MHAKKQITVHLGRDINSYVQSAVSWLCLCYSSNVTNTGVLLVMLSTCARRIGRDALVASCNLEHHEKLEYVGGAGKEHEIMSGTFHSLPSWGY